MGKGDRRSRRGKLFAGTYGKSRPHKTIKTRGPKPPAKGAIKKK